MGFFDTLLGQQETASPEKDLMISMLYLVYADGEVQPEELGCLISVLGGETDSRGITHIGGLNNKSFKQALNYVRNNPSPDGFIKESDTRLGYAQKLYVIANMIDISLSDDDADDTEQELISQFTNGWGVDIDALKMIYGVLELKNDKSIFKNPKPSNEDSFNLKLKLNL